MPDKAIAEGRADKNYLKGWNGAEPNDSGSGAVVSVSWWAARAYCQSGRGGLASLEAAPKSWAEGPGQPMHELRQDGTSQARWRRYDNTTSSNNAISPAETSRWIGFRCAR